MVVVPTAVPVTRPPLAPLPTVAMPAGDELQPAVAVKSWVVPSEKTPCAVSCTVVPLAIEGFGGVIVIEVSVAAVTVTVADPETPAWVAVMVSMPSLVPVTRPPLAPLPTVAMPAGDELQPAVAVKSWVVPSENTPCAVSCTVVPLAIEGFGGVIVIEVSVAAVTVTVADPETPA